MKLKIGLPKGSLQESTVKMFARAGFNISISSRSYYPVIDDPQMQGLLIRAQEMARYVASGVLDCGLTGNDWILENNASVIKAAELGFSKQSLNPVRWVLAVPENSKIKTVKGLSGKIIATELVNVTRKYLKKNKVKAKVEFSWGATEVKTPDLADAIVELTETGSSLRANKLRIIDTILTSTTQFIASKDAWKNKAKRNKIENIAMLLQGAILAREKVGLKMNVSQKDLKKVLNILPAMKRPTISGLSEDGWFDVDTVINESTVRRLIPRLKRAGAEGIIEYPLNKVIY